MSRGASPGSRARRRRSRDSERLCTAVAGGISKLRNGAKRIHVAHRQHECVAARRPRSGIHAGSEDRAERHGGLPRARRGRGITSITTRRPMLQCGQRVGSRSAFCVVVGRDAVYAAGLWCRVRGRRRFGGRREQRARGIEAIPIGGAEEGRVTDLGESLGEHVREEAGDELLGRDGGGLDLVGLVVAVVEARPCRRRRERSRRLLAMAMRKR